jgi:S1-C subfamily serine protease
MRSAPFLLVLALAPSPARAAVPDDPLLAVEQRQQRLFEAIAPAVVFVRNERGFGSGFFVSASGLVLTNAHVVGAASSVAVVLHDGRQLGARVVERAAANVDLALLQVPVARVPHLVLAGFEQLRVGSWVAAVGHGRGGIWTFNVGMVSNIYPSGAERPVFQTQIPLNPGSSGGPIVDRLGRVVGIVTAGLTNSNSINFGIKSSVALDELRGLEPHCRCLRITAPARVPIFVDGKLAGAGPRLLVPARERSYEVFAVIRGTMVRRSVRYPAQRAVDLAP